MDSGELFRMMIFLVGAFLFGLVGLVALGWFVDIQKQFRKKLILLIYPIILIASALGTLLANRNVTNADFEDILDATDVGLITWFFRLTTAFVLGICLVRFISVSQGHEKRSRNGRALFIAFLFFYLSNVVLNNLFGAQPAFYERFIPSAVIFIAIYFSRNQDPRVVMNAVKWGALVFITASWLVAAVSPGVVIQQEYAGYLPFTDIRFWGLAGHPNSAGPLAIVFLLLVTYQPFKRRWIQYPAIIMALATLVLAQSKTAWASAVIAFFLVWWHQKVQAPRASRGRRYSSYYALRDFAGPVLVCVAGLALIAAFAVLNFYESYFAALDQERQLTTLTGRTEIWGIAIDTWKQHPIFGYGSSIWNTEFRRSVGIDAAVTAHSQFFQSLSEAGTVGFVGFVVYLGLLWRYALAANRVTGGFSFALFSIFFVRCITETPFDMTTIFSNEFVAHLLLFHVALQRSPQTVAVSVPQARQQYQMG